VRLDRLTAVNAVQATTAEAATNVATADAPNPTSTNAQAENATTYPVSTTSARHQSPGRLRIYHARKATTRIPP
jgi:hypothetical protein